MTLALGQSRTPRASTRQQEHLRLMVSTGPSLNSQYKDCLSRYRDAHSKSKIVMAPSVASMFVRDVARKQISRGAQNSQEVFRIAHTCSVSKRGCLYCYFYVNFKFNELVHKPLLQCGSRYLMNLLDVWNYPENTSCANFWEVLVNFWEVLHLKDAHWLHPWLVLLT